MRTMIAALILLTSSALAQEPSEQVKKQALMEAYRLNGNSMSRFGDSIDLSPGSKLPCHVVKGEATGSYFFDCPQVVKTERIAPTGQTMLDRGLTPPPVDCKKRHGIRKDERCK